MSTGLQDVGLKIGDYQAAPDKTLYNNIGPQCAKCNKPYKQCVCPPLVEIPGEHRPDGNPAQRSAEAMEILAVTLGKGVKLLERIAELLEKKDRGLVVPEDLLQSAAVILPDVAPVPPVLDEATLARNAAKKEELLSKLPGGKK